MVDIREIEKGDLMPLLDLYTQLHNNVIPTLDEKIESLWEDILSDKNHHIILGLLNGEVISSCVLIVAPNLTRGQRPYALIENVITHEKHRNKGYASLLLNHARDIAKAENCYKIMFMTGAKKETTLNRPDSQAKPRQPIANLRASLPVLVIALKIR